MELIKRIGVAFVEPLLQRLADESSMSKRRLLIECLHVIGRAARDPIVAHLHDRRWFFVRNLVILLRMMNDPTVLQPLGHLVGYDNANVQFEVMRTFLHFNDPRADRYLIGKLESNDPGILINVTRLAANSRNPEVARKLSEILNRKLLKEADENIKSAVIKTLAEMALPDALPELERFLFSRSLLQTMQGNNLKIMAVRTLARYSAPAAVVLAEKVYRKTSGELARIAGQVCQQLKGKQL
jgi:HEAT repeat protein